MQRRTALKQLAFASAALLLIPRCMQDKGKVSILLKKISIDADQEKLVAELCESIIPKTNTPGANDINAHLFALMMVDDCYKTEDQQKFMEGLKAFETNIKKQFGASFVNCSNIEKEKVLTELEAKKTGNENIAYFYATLKELTVQSYTASKFYLTEIQEYKLVPGKYKGCVAIKKITADS